MRPQERKPWGQGMFGGLLLPQDIVIGRGAKSQSGNVSISTGKGHLAAHQLSLLAPDVGFPFVLRLQIEEPRRLSVQPPFIL